MARKRDLIRKVKRLFINSNIDYYNFPENTTLNLYYYEELKTHTLISLELNKESNNITLITYVDGNRESDNLADFDCDEVGKIVNLITTKINAYTNKEIITLAQSSLIE